MSCSTDGGLAVIEREKEIAAGERGGGGGRREAGRTGS